MIEIYATASIALTIGLCVGRSLGRYSARAELNAAKRHRLATVYLLAGYRERNRCHRSLN